MSQSNPLFRGASRVQHYCPNCYSDSLYAPYSENGTWPKITNYQCGAIGIVEITGKAALARDCPRRSVVSDPKSLRVYRLSDTSPVSREDINALTAKIRRNKC